MNEIKLFMFDIIRKSYCERNKNSFNINDILNNIYVISVKEFNMRRNC